MVDHTGTGRDDGSVSYDEGRIWKAVDDVRSDTYEYISADVYIPGDVDARGQGREFADAGRV